jgi:hypothetical protein
MTALVIALVLLLAVAWQVLDAILQPPAVEPQSSPTMRQERELANTVFHRVIDHLKKWYKDGF